MPANARERLGVWSHLVDGDLIAPLNSAADDLHVTSSALRWRLGALGECFVVPGGGHTISNGEPMTMQPGDPLIQPNRVWHDHVNHSRQPIIWIDALDVDVRCLHPGVGQEYIPFRLTIDPADAFC